MNATPKCDKCRKADAVGRYDVSNLDFQEEMNLCDHCVECADAYGIDADIIATYLGPKYRIAEAQ